MILVVLGGRRGVHGAGAIAITRLWWDELNLEIQGVIGLCRWRSYDDERLMIRPPLLSLDATFLGSADYIARLWIFNLYGWHVLVCGVGRVGGTLLQGRGKK